MSEDELDELMDEMFGVHPQDAEVCSHCGTVNSDENVLCYACQAVLL